MRNSSQFGRIWKVPGAVPLALFIILLAILGTRESVILFEMPIHLALLNSIFLCLIPLIVAFLAAKSHRATGSLSFMLMGCGLVVFGYSSLLAGWVMPLSGGPNPTVTLHNLGSLLAGLFQVAGAHCALREIMVGRNAVSRSKNCFIVYAVIVLAISIVGFLAYKSYLPLFFNQATGPTLLRQSVLGGAICLFALAGYLFMVIYSTTKTDFAYWYGLALWLIAIGLAGVFLQHKVGDALGWTGRAAQYIGCSYFMLTFLMGRRDIALSDDQQDNNADWNLWPFLEQKVIERTSELTRMNETLQQEIQERKETEEALFISEEKYRHLICALPDIIYSFDLMRGGAYYSPAVQTVLGYSSEYMLEHPLCWHDSIHPDDLQKVESAIENFKTGVPFNLEYRFQHADGHWIWLNDRSTDQPRIISATTRIEGIAKDITERKEAEERLQENRTLLNSIINGTSDAVYVKDLNGRYMLFNAAAERAVGKSMADVLGKDDYFIFPPEEAMAVMESDRKVIDGGTVVTYEEFVTDATGQEITFLSTKGPLLDSSGQPTGIFGIARDITKRKRTEEDLLEAKERAESGNRAKSEFLANMSHEIRTPMNGVLGMAQLLEMTDLTKEQQQYVATLKFSGKNLLSLINDILDLSKIEAGKITVEFADFSLHQSIKDIVMMQKQVAHQKGLLLNVNLADDIPHVLRGDQQRFKQILLNLLGNAIKFTADGGVTVSTQLLEQRDDTVLVQIAVRDTGIGVSSGALEQIFKPFVQEDGSTTRRYGGTGLGLTISRRLAELMGGSISIESTSGAGSCFKVNIPFAVVKGYRVNKEASKKTAVSWDGPPLRILLVEDDETNITFATSLFRKLGLDVIVAQNGRECLAALEQGRFDLVLMDIQMPVMNGEEALKEIRGKEQITSLHQPVIALTAYSMRGDKERFLEEGFDGYLSKPLETRELVSEMKLVMRTAVKSCS